MSQAGDPMIPSGDWAVCQGSNVSWGSQPPGVPNKHPQSPGNTPVVWCGKGGTRKPWIFFSHSCPTLSRLRGLHAFMNLIPLHVWGRGQTNGTMKTARKKQSPQQYYSSSIFVYRICIVSPQPHCAGWRHPKIDNWEPLRRMPLQENKNTKLWVAIFIPNKMIQSYLKDGNFRILVGHITNVQC